MVLLRRVFRQMVNRYKELHGKTIEKEVKKEEENVIKPIDFASKLPETISIKKLKRIETIRKEIAYPLVPKNPTKNEPIFSYVKIRWRKDLGGYFYEVKEPPLTDKLEKMIDKIKELLEQKLDIDLAKVKKLEAKKYLKEKIQEIVKYFELTLSQTEMQILNYYIERDFLGYGKINPLMIDPNIEDISCDGVNIPLYVFHRDPEIGSVPTNILFESSEELDNFIIKLVQLTGKSISVAEPLVDGTLPDGSRLQATLGTDIARRGSNFTIRKFSEKPLTPTLLIMYNTLSSLSLAYLWLAIDYGRSVLISGGTASGKTTLLNVLSLFIRPNKKIVSIEDTAELRLPHPHWLPSVARTPIAENEKSVDLFKLLKESLRQRPDYIVLGEVRGKEAYILFQQIATGHPSLATIHAENVDKLIDRLITPPISLPPSLISDLDLVVFIQQVRRGDKTVRRVTEIMEILDFNLEKNKPNSNIVFKWDPSEDILKPSKQTYLIPRISKLTGIPIENLVEEIRRRQIVLEWMKDKKIVDFEDVYKIIKTYYNYPNKLLAMIKSDYE